jgi:alpha-glucosidase
METERDVDAESWKDYPLYVRRGAIIPTAAPINWVGEKAIDPVIVEIYPDAQPSSFLYYDDDGLTYAYEKGAYYSVPLACRRDGDKVIFTIEKPEGSFAAPHHAWDLRFHMLDQKPGTVTLDGQKVESKIEQATDGSIVRVTVPVGRAARVEIGIETKGEVHERPQQ